MSPQVESSKALAAVMNRRNYDRERIGEDVDVQITRLVCLPGFFRQCKVKIWGQERFYYLPLHSLDNSQQGKGKVFRINKLAVYFIAIIMAFRVRVKPLLVVLVRFDKTSFNTTYQTYLTLPYLALPYFTLSLGVAERRDSTAHCDIKARTAAFSNFILSPIGSRILSSVAS